MKPSRKRREVQTEYGHRVLMDRVELAPNDGEPFVHCEHPHTRPITFVKMPFSQNARDAQGRPVQVRFASACDVCIGNAKGDFNRIAMYGVDYWKRSETFQSN
jgi:hypothetical protein